MKNKFHPLFCFLQNIIIFRNSCNCITISICSKSIFSHIASSLFNFPSFIIFSDFLCIFCSLIFQTIIFFTTNRIYSVCGFIKFLKLISLYNLSNAISKAPIPEKKLLNLRSSNKYGIATYNSLYM